MSARWGAARGTAGARILGIGAYRPARLVDNHALSARIDSSDEWIRKRSGIESRRFAGPDETVVSMAGEAAVKALAQAGVTPDRVDAVLVASMSHLEQVPPAAPRVAGLIGARGAGAMDVGAACAGFCYVLALGDALIRAGTAEHVVAVGAEKMSDLVSPDDRSTAFLFGDGAGAVVLGPDARPRIGPAVWGAEGERHRLIAYDRSWLAAREEPEPWPVLRLAGPEVFRWAVNTVPRIAQRALDAAGLAAGDLAAFIPHQANSRIVDTAARELGLPPHVVIARDVVTSANTSAASIPLAMDALGTRGELPSGGKALLVGFGAGLTYAAQVVELP
ncbi:ketoacyl-ACP synthase III [Streptomyces armeniacus]|uniref:Beta-ketoacyl-[acyl-carrier-protein] synthase III n=1 Tax=Streptomyces armeniacus TaxID=83291 RepID=A0A345XRN7_9ACTN|nr:beta-ketoacyl-ACP synthase III [Streptomyces armeniacus]AWS21284.1 3-oxoacyl-ACP synthase [Streptomyces armeniacus]AXK34303.1 ketoacyl-ACP synthase III [Streptomyces armeniacus]AZY92010.1 putative 3-oxoacyl-(acyl-carrier-protein) synthase III [Streptomyces armeniacus]